MRKAAFDTVLAVIKNSVGSHMFRQYYVRVNGKRRDILRNGELSCAFYVSSLLYLFNSCESVHTTVHSTVLDLRRSGWKPIPKPKIGCVLVWEAIDFGDNDVHKHIGFYLGNNQAISHSYTKRCPVKHHWKFRNRDVELMLWNPLFSNKNGD